MARFQVSLIALVYSCLNRAALAAPPTDIQPNLIYYNTLNTTHGSAFLKNLEDVFQYLVINSQAPERNFSSGAYPDIVYGLSQCYSSQCDQCLRATYSDHESISPLAVGFREYFNRSSYSCYLRFENYNFRPGEFTTMNVTVPNVTKCKKQNPPEGAANDLHTLLVELIANTVITGPSTQRHNAFYGFANCYSTGQANCTQCLTGIRNDFNATCPLAVGAERLVNISSSYICFLQYEELQSSASTAALPKQRDSSNVKTITLVVISCVIAVVLMVAGCFLHKKRYKTKLRDQAFCLPGDPEGNFTYDELRTATEDFQEHNKIGQGGFGDVYKGILADGREVAIKRLHLEADGGKEDFLNEVKIVSSIQHRNLVRMEGYCATVRGRLLVLEYISNGTLDQALHGRALDLDWPTRQNIILGIARGLAYLHEESYKLIIHRDIKTSNILLDDKLDPKISDFGISKPLDRDGDTSLNSTTRIIGTIGYIAPEYALRGELTDKADVFSFGMLVLEIVSGRRCKDQALPTVQRFLLNWSLQLYLGKQLEDILDPALDLTSDSSKAGALRTLHIALLCTQQNAESRPKMSRVVTLLTDYDRELPQLALHSDIASEADALLECFAASSSTQSSSQEAITVLAPR